ncbi:MAG: hypothetical protein Q9216_001678 [Gyalolechia sp. 2 TL-2023]
MSGQIKQVAESLWGQYAANINHGFIDKIVVDPMVANAIGQAGLNLIVERYEFVLHLQDCTQKYSQNSRAMVQAPITMTGGGPGAISIYPTHKAVGRKAVTAVEPIINKKDKVARPPNAFILYRQFHHNKIVAQHPKLHNNQISIILGKQWQNEKTEVKALFKDMAEDIKRKHLSAHPDYQYQPRKPAEKKRRMTRHKAGLKTVAGVSCNSGDVAITDPTFDKTSTGNAVFTLGDDMIDENALMTMINSHNEDVLSSSAPYNSIAPAFFHETPGEVQDDVNFYGNTINFDDYFKEQYGIEALLPAEQVAVDAITGRTLKERENLYDQHITKLQHAELVRQNTNLAKYSHLWSDEVGGKDDFEAAVASV